jgi:hypothetical protein
LEQVVIAPVDQGDVHGEIGQVPARREASEPPTHDDDAMS